jgi:hypothetical protein
MSGGDVVALLVLLSPTLLGFLSGRWWVVVAVAGVWMAYIAMGALATDAHERAEFELEFLALGALLTTVATSIGVVIRRLVRRRRMAVR